MIAEALIIKGALALIKGAVVASKCSAAKAALAKAAPHIATKAVAYVKVHGLAATATTLAQTTASTCAIAGFASLPIGMANGYKKMLQGIIDGDKQMFIEGLLKAKSLGSDITSLSKTWADFSDIIRAADDLDLSAKDMILSAGNELLGLAQAEIEMEVSSNTYDYVESYLRHNNFSLKQYIDEVQSIYTKYLGRKYKYSKDDVIAVAGQIYQEIFLLNLRAGLWQSRNEFDHTLVYMIAGWIIEHLPLTFSTDQKELAKLTGTAILNWIKGENLSR